MAQRIKVQDGIVGYSSGDPTTVDVNFGVEGQMAVSKQVTVGTDLVAAGSIATLAGSAADLIISTNTDGATAGNIKLAPTTGGKIFLNNITWPDGTVAPVPGMFLGVASAGNLQFYPFVLGTQPVDTLTPGDLNGFYPNAMVGQSVIGPTVVYQCVGIDTWRILGQGGGSGGGDVIADTEIAFGTGTGITSSLAFTYDESNSSFYVNDGAVPRASSTVLIRTTSNPTDPFGGASLELTAPGTEGASSVSLLAGRASVSGQPGGQIEIFAGQSTQDIGGGIYIRSGSGSEGGPINIEAGNGGAEAAGGDVYIAAGVDNGKVTIATNGVDRFEIMPEGEIALSGDSGTPGYVLTSNGTGTAATWEPSSGGGGATALTIKTVSGDYTIIQADAYNTLIQVSSPTPSVVTIPDDATDNLPIGSAILIGWYGIGQVSVAAAPGVTLNSPYSLNIGVRFGKVVVIKTAADTWDIDGNLHT